MDAKVSVMFFVRYFIKLSECIPALFPSGVLKYLAKLGMRCVAHTRALSHDP
jgi:hypothetical protein